MYYCVDYHRALLVVSEETPNRQTWIKYQVRGRGIAKARARSSFRVYPVRKWRRSQFTIFFENRRDVSLQQSLAKAEIACVTPFLCWANRARFCGGRLGTTSVAGNPNATSNGIEPRGLRHDAGALRATGGGE